MKKYVVWTLAGMMMMAPAVYAADTATPPAPTGPSAKGLETTQPSKEVAKAPVAPHKNKKKKVKSLTPTERREMENRVDTTMPPEAGPANEPVK